MQPNDFPVTSQNRVRQYATRARYDRMTVFAILDDGLVAHVGFTDGEQPTVIPMIYGRDGDRVFLHGARRSRLVRSVADERVCIAVTLLDGIVAATSLFDTSMNYRAVVAYGRAREIVDPSERERALRRIVEHQIPDRWSELSLPNERELAATSVLEVDIESASAKIRSGPSRSTDDPSSAGVWTGVVPLTLVPGAPIADAHVAAAVPIPASIRRLANRHTVQGVPR